MKKYTNYKGFTVLEFLIVVAIMTILVALILVGLTSARKNSRDQARVSHVQSIVVGLVQFYDICRFYPPVLDSTTPYLCLDNKTFKSLVPDIDDFQINTANGEYHYAALANPLEPNTCTGAHIGVDLETSDASYKGTKSGVAASNDICAGSDLDFDGTASDVFDIRK